MRNKASFMFVAATKEVFTDYNHFHDFLSVLCVFASAADYYSIRRQEVTARKLFLERNASDKQKKMFISDVVDE